MGKETIVDSLQALVDNNTGRSQIDRLTDIFGEVEATLSAGVPRQAVLDTLHKKYGFTISMSGFEKALAKLRKTRIASSKKMPLEQAPELVGELVVNSPEPFSGEFEDVINEDEEAYLGSMDEKQEKGFIPKLDDFVAGVEKKTPSKRVLIVKIPNKT